MKKFFVPIALVLFLCIFQACNESGISTTDSFGTSSTTKVNDPRMNTLDEVLKKSGKSEETKKILRDFTLNLIHNETDGAGANSGVVYARSKCHVYYMNQNLGDFSINMASVSKSLTSEGDETAYFDTPDSSQWVPIGNGEYYHYVNFGYDVLDNASWTGQPVSRYPFIEWDLIHMLNSQTEDYYRNDQYILPTESGSYSQAHDVDSSHHMQANTSYRVRVHFYLQPGNIE